MTRNHPETPSAGDNSRSISESGKCGLFVRSALGVVLVAICAKPVNAEKMPTTFIYGNPNAEQIGPNEAKIPLSVQRQLFSLKQKGIDWNKLQEDLNSIDPVLDELISEPGIPSLFKIGDELIIDENLSDDSKSRLAELMDKYKITDLEQSKVLLAKKELTPEDCEFLRLKMIEIVRAQKKILSLSIKTRQRLMAMGLSVVKNGEAAGRSQGELALFKEWCADLEQSINTYKNLLQQLDDFERDLQ